jgi:Saxitoxin biosynthesis operon protein SxtJ
LEAQGQVSHEDFSRAETTKISSNRSFGFVIGGAFLLIGLLPLLHAPHRPRWWAIIIATIFAGFAQLRPDLLGPLNKLWLRFGLLLHKIVSPVILGLLFYTTVLPVGLLMRAFGKDPMRLHKDPTAESYWILREPPGPSPESMTQQF